MDFERILADVQDTLTVMANIQSRQAASEATDKLHGLIGFMDDFMRRRRPQ